MLLIGITAMASRAPVLGQNATGLTFEVVSVKPSNSNPSGPLAGAPKILPAGGRFVATNVPLRLLVRAAYSLQDFQIVGGPSWQLSRKFDINAKAEDTSIPMDAMRPMLRALLADRFKLKVHTETKEMPVFALVIARRDGQLGPKLKASTDECPDRKVQQQQMVDAIARGGLGALATLMPRPGETRSCSIAFAPAGPGMMSIRATGQPIAVMVPLLTQLMQRSVRDSTGLVGLYDWELTFSLQMLAELATQVGVAAAPVAADSDALPLPTTLREDLGLRLDSQTGPLEVLVIDSAEMPMPD
jgi:uncharacterized protein (TIGR03435 family)